MKTNKKVLHQQRLNLDQKIKDLPLVSPPKKGWIRAVRNSFGLSTRGLAELMGTSHPNVQLLEKSEQKRAITLASLKKAAAAMDCELVYMFVPKAPYKSLDDILERRSVELAARISKGVSYSMTLEDQKVPEDITDTQIKNLAAELKNVLDSRMWLSNTNGRKK